MVEEIIMPKVGKMDADTKVTGWLVKEGDKVTAGQSLCEIESQEETKKVESKSSGTVLEIFIKEDEKVAIGTVLATISKEKDLFKNFKPGEGLQNFVFKECN
jgi:pyruvate/2-oxoglutarate dehydrogenase complex dihydrolipoamide acyltransferase (E2) component